MTKRIIDVATKEGGVSVEADVFGNWAVHTELHSLSRYTLTHIPSGLKTPEHALLMMGATTKKRLVAIAKAMRDEFPQKKVTRAISKRMHASMKRHNRHAEQVMRRARAR